MNSENEQKNYSLLLQVKNENTSEKMRVSKFKALNSFFDQAHSLHREGRG